MESTAQAIAYGLRVWIACGGNRGCSTAKDAIVGALPTMPWTTVSRELRAAS
jgi:hypothetical protein